LRPGDSALVHPAAHFIESAQVGGNIRMAVIGADHEALFGAEFEQRLDVLETLIRDAWMLSLGSESNQLVNEDLSSELRRISQRIDPSKAAAWILEIEDMREQLIVNINRKPATDALFLTMASGEIPVRRISIK